MGTMLVRNVADATKAGLKKKAKTAGKSLNDIAREALDAAAKPSKEEIWAEIDRFRERIGPVSGDSTADIREDRDNDEPYR
jgi:plasmid stability protein